MLHATCLPLIEELDTDSSPLTLFELFKNEQFCFFLDSAMDKQKLGRYSFMGSQPFLVFSSLGNNITIAQNGQTTTKQGNLFDVLGKYLGMYKIELKEAPVPFCGGAVGYFSYDLCHFIEQLPKTAIDDLQLPESHFGFYDLILAYDNMRNKAYLLSTGFPELNETKRIKRAGERIDEFKKKLTTVPGKIVNRRMVTAAPAKVKLKSNFTHKNYLRAVEKVRRYIIEGDIFEVNISQRFKTEISITPYELYSRLRRKHNR